MEPEVLKRNPVKEMVLYRDPVYTRHQMEFSCTETHGVNQSIVNGVASAFHCRVDYGDHKNAIVSVSCPALLYRFVPCLSPGL